MIESLLIGTLSSFIASIIFISALYYIRPKIDISPFIARSKNEEGKTTYKWKIVNKQRRKVINLKAEIHILRTYNIPDGKGSDSKKIELKRNEIFCLAPYNKAEDAMNFDFRFITYEDIESLWEDKGGRCIRLQVSATDAFSNFTKIFTKLYYKKRFSIKEGVHLAGSSLDVG